MPTVWDLDADLVLNGAPLPRARAAAMLACPDDELLELLAAAYRVRRHYFGNTVQLYMLVNAKSGLCQEDCHYCSQSRISDAPIDKYKLLSAEQLLDGARLAAQRQAKTYCIVISGRSPTAKEMEAITTVVPRIKERYPLGICACLGLLNDEEARRLKACGVDRVNHNLNTSEERYAEICTTHTYADRLATLNAVRAAGLELCSGGIIGMGESADDIVAMAYALRELNVESIPINFLHPIDGTPLAKRWELNPRGCLKALCMVRMVNPASELRIAGGRELHLRSLQAMGLYPANSIFVGDYLTTSGQAAAADLQMIRDLGFEVVRREMDGVDDGGSADGETVVSPAGFALPVLSN